MKNIFKVLAGILGLLGITAIVWIALYFTVPKVKDWTNTNIFKQEQQVEAGNEEDAGKIEELEAELAQAIKDKEEAQAQLATKTEELETALAGKTEVETQLAGVNTQLAEKQALIEELQQDATVDEATIAELQADVTELTSSKQELEATLDQKNSTIEALEAEVAELESALEKDPSKTYLLDLVEEDIALQYIVLGDNVLVCNAITNNGVLEKTGLYLLNQLDLSLTQLVNNGYGFDQKFQIDETHYLLSGDLAPLVVIDTNNITNVKVTEETGFNVIGKYELANGDYLMSANSGPYIIRFNPETYSITYLTFTEDVGSTYSLKILEKFDNDNKLLVSTVDDMKLATIDLTTNTVDVLVRDTYGIYQYFTLGKIINAEKVIVFEQNSQTLYVFSLTDGTELKNHPCENFYIDPYFELDGNVVKFTSEGSNTTVYYNLYSDAFFETNNEGYAVSIVVKTKNAQGEFIDAVGGTVEVINDPDNNRIYCNATANEGYQFYAYYQDADCTTYMTVTTGFVNYTDIPEGGTFYALFVENSEA